MLFSVIVPIYNSQEYLENCIDSLVNQLYSNIEIILVDDGSTDSSLGICHRYSSLDPRIKVFTKTNGGQASARNLGLQYVSGDYVLFVDSDDAISLDLLQLNYPLLQQGKVDCLQFPLLLNYTSENEEKITCTPIENCFLQNKKVIINDWLVKCTISWIVCNKIVKTKIAKEIQFVENMVYEDNNYVVHLINLIQNITLSNQGCYYYYKRPNSTTTSTLTLKKEMDTITVLENLLSTFKDCFELDLFLVYLIRIINIEKSVLINFKQSISVSKYHCSSISTLDIFFSKEISFKDKFKLLQVKFG